MSEVALSALLPTRISSVRVAMWAVEGDCPWVTEVGHGIHLPGGAVTDGGDFGASVQCSGTTPAVV